mgnify:CR=1 FL=1
MFAVAQHLFAVDPHVHHALGVLVGLLEGCAIAHPVRVEHDDVGVVARRQAATLVQLQVGCGKGGQAAHGFLELALLAVGFGEPFGESLGLFAFFYVLMHFLVWLFLDQGLLLSAIGEDIAERPFITIGFAAFVILLALAMTSTTGMRRRLGKRWQTLHNGAYVAAILGVWHYWWQVKLDASDPLIYAIILTALLGWRVWRRRAPKPSARPA